MNTIQDWSIMMTSRAKMNTRFVEIKVETEEGKAVLNLELEELQWFIKRLQKAEEEIK